jgi:hypothetical protein
MRRKKAKSTLSKDANKIIKSLMITLASMIMILSVVFILTVNESAEKGYTLEMEKTKNEQLRSENSRITRQVGSSASFIEIKDNLKIKTMQEVAEQIFVTREDNKVR